MFSRRPTIAVCLLLSVVLLTEGVFVSISHRHHSPLSCEDIGCDEVSGAAAASTSCGHDHGAACDSGYEGEGLAIAPSIESQSPCASDCAACRYWSLRQLSSPPVEVTEWFESAAAVAERQRALAGEPSLIVCRQRGPPLA